MPRLALRYAVLALANLQARALFAGLLLGMLVHALAAQREGGDFALAMALLMVGSGAVAFVLHALDATAAARAGAGAAAALGARVRGWTMLLGLGIVVGANGFSLIGA